MNAATGTVAPILATPFGVMPLQGSQSLNPVLADLFSARAREQDAAAIGAQRYRSQDDLFLWPQPQVKQLAEEMSRSLLSVVRAVNEFDETELNSFSVEARAWVTILEQHGYVAATNYPLSAWCAVYCVAAPEPSTRGDSGELRIHESRLGAMYRDVSTASMRAPYRAAHYGWRPVPGQMAAFPAAATHEIAVLRSAGPLILVTARFRFLAPGQPGIGRW